MIERAQMTEDLEKIIDQWKDQEGNLIMILHQIQNKYSYVPREISLEISSRLNVPLARIYEVITFYHYFKLEKPGDHIVSVCTGTACYLKGADKIIQGLENKLGVRPGQTTKDKKFHVQVVRCLGCCSLAPVMTIDGKVYAKVTEDQIPQIIDAVKNETPQAAN